MDRNSLIIGLESTAHYGDNLVRYLVDENYKVCVLNPIKTSSMRKNNIRKTKTDKVDTYIICKTLMMQDSLRFVSFYDLDLMERKRVITTRVDNHDQTFGENYSTSFRQDLHIA